MLGHSLIPDKAFYQTRARSITEKFKRLSEITWLNRPKMHKPLSFFSFDTPFFYPTPFHLPLHGRIYVTVPEWILNVYTKEPCVHSPKSIMKPYFI